MSADWLNKGHWSSFTKQISMWSIFDKIQVKYLYFIKYRPFSTDLNIYVYVFREGDPALYRERLRFKWTMFIEHDYLIR